MQKIASEKAIQKFNVENDDLIDGKGILLGFLMSILIWLIIIILITAFWCSFSLYPSESPLSEATQNR